MSNIPISKLRKHFGSSRVVQNIETLDENETRKKHFTSECHRVKIYFDDGKSISLFIKQMPSNKNSKDFQIIKKNGLFDKETGFYTKLLNDLDTFCLKAAGTTSANDHSVKDFFPRFYHASDSLICLDNLTVKSTYSQFNCSNNMGQDLQHAKIVLTKLGKFHASSYVMIETLMGKVERKREKFIEEYPCLKEAMFLINQSPDDSLVSFIDPVMNSLIKLVKNSEGSPAFLTDILSKYENCSFSKLCEIVEEPAIFDVVNLGDCWNGNMGFFYDENSNGPKDVKFFDLQVSRVNSPSLDISYYFNSLNVEIRRLKFMDLLQHYFDAFTLQTQSLGIYLPFSFEDFLEDFRRKAVLGFIFGLCNIIFWNFVNRNESDGVKLQETESQNKLFTFVAKSSAKWLDENLTPEVECFLVNEIRVFVNDFSKMGIYC